MSLDFTGRNVVVTGAARGIGQSIAEAFHSRGANVILADVLPDVAETAGALGERATGVRLDVTDAAAAQDFVKAVVKEHGSLDVLVNNAGITRDQLLPRMKTEDFDLVMKVNLYGTFHLTQAASRPMMKARGGRIVNVASVIGLHGNAGQANYAASKGGVIALTKATAKEMAARGVTVNAIAPGFIRTPMTDDLPETVQEQMLSVIPLSRFGEPKDVTGVVLFLSSDLAAYVTGQVIVVDGGMFI